MKHALKMTLISLLLAGCTSQKTMSTVPPTTSKTHLLEIQFTGVGTPSMTSQIHAVGGPSRVQKQAFTEASGLTFAYRGSDTHTSDDGLTRYVQVHYLVTNTSGQTYHNLGFLPVVLSDTDGDSSNNSTSPTVAGTPFRSVKHFDGTTAPDSTAQGMTPTYAKRFNTEGNILQNLTTTSTYRSGLDVTGFDVTDPTGLEVTEVKNEGWKFQKSLASGESRVMTFSISYPVPADRKLAPFSFSLMAAYADGIPDLDFYGNSLNEDPGKSSYHPWIELNSAGEPLVVWAESSAQDPDVYVKHWNGSTWEKLGTRVGYGELNNSNYPAMALTSTDAPVVIYSIVAETLVKKWDGNDWVKMGDSVSTSNLAYWQDIAINSQDQPVVSVHQSVEANYQILVKQWNGSNWVQLGSGLRVNASGFPMENSIAVGPDDLPVVAWRENNPPTSYDIYVKKWNGSTWVQLGSALDLTASNHAYEPDIQVDSDGNPVVVWRERFSGTDHNIYVKRWDGSNWVQLGGALDNAVSTNIVFPRLKLNSQNQPVVTFAENGGVVVKTWNGSGWVQSSSTYQFGTGTASFPALALDDEDTPIVTWVEDSDLYVKR